MKKFLIGLIVCICFFVAITKQGVRLSNERTLLFGNIEALSQREDPEQGNRQSNPTEEICYIRNEKNQIIGWGYIISCISGKRFCIEGCVNPN